MVSCRRASGYCTDRLSLFFADIFDGGGFDQMGDVGIGFLRAFVGVDDARHQRMAHHVLAAKLREGDAAHVAQHLDGVDQAALLRLVQVDLRDVAGDHGLAAEADPGQEHLHLLDGGVLRLVEDDEGVVQRAPAIIRRRGVFDDLLSNIFWVRSKPSRSYSASYSGRRYGSTFCARSPGRKPRRSPASTAGRVRMMRLTASRSSASTAQATAR